MDALANILKDALTLKPALKMKLIDELLLSLDYPDKELGELWAKEAEARIDAYEQGKLKAIPIEKVIEKYK
ncbi:MAG: addiction module protein [Myxococcota bacterium]|nr:addiction module protein [Myxococcota bacterium]